MDARTFMELNESGKSFAEIAAQFGVSRNTVAGAIWRAKYPDRKDAYLEKVRIAKQAKLEIKQAERAKERIERLRAKADAAKPINDRDRLILAKMREGWSYRKIGHFLRISGQAVQQQYNRMLSDRSERRNVVAAVSKDQREQFVSLYESGATVKQISMLTAFSEYVIRKILHFSNVQLRNGRPEGARNIAGERFGFLTAVSPQGKYRNEYRWLCRCDCGGKRVARITTLRAGHAKSCGCIRRGQKRAKPSGDHPRLNDTQLQRAVALWMSGRFPAEIASDLGMPSEAAVSNSLADWREQEYLKRRAA